MDAIKGLLLLFAILPSTPCFAQRRLDEPPIDYRETVADNPIAELANRLAAGEASLQYEPGFGYLRSILDELEIPVSSQSLVFSKTSLQTSRISPSNPRAFYFNDDVYIGWIRGSSLMEVATADPVLGAVFYSIQMNPRQASIRREHHRCLVCHEKTVESGKVPMHTITSVMARKNGTVNLLLAEYQTDHTSPFSQRWGGWYVTGKTGSMEHMGNAFLEDEDLVPMNPHALDHLEGVISTSSWPTPFSDIVALMVLEHQVEMHNRLTRANYAVRRIRYRADEDEEVGQSEITKTIENSAESIVEYLLFVGETEIDSPIAGSSDFTDQFGARGPSDSKGRSLRQFDLKERLFRYPCSYIIYSKQFDGLEPELLERVYQKLRNVLEGKDQREKFDHLSQETRQAILEILTETKADF